MDEWWAEFRRTRYDPDAGDVDLLQNLDLYVVKALDPVDRARDVVFSDDRIVLT
jgi:hypothetical protein